MVWIFRSDAALTSGRDQTGSIVRDWKSVEKTKVPGRREGRRGCQARDRMASIFTENRPPTKRPDVPACLNDRPFGAEESIGPVWIWNLTAIT